MSPDVFIFILRQYDTDVFSERVTPHHCDVCVMLSAIPWHWVFASRCSALHEHHREKQTHRLWGAERPTEAVSVPPFSPYLPIPQAAP